MTKGGTKRFFLFLGGGNDDFSFFVIEWPQNHIFFLGISSYFQGFGGHDANDPQDPPLCMTAHERPGLPVRHIGLLRVTNTASPWLTESAQLKQAGISLRAILRIVPRMNSVKLVVSTLSNIVIFYIFKNFSSDSNLTGCFLELRNKLKQINGLPLSFRIHKCCG